MIYAYVILTFLMIYHYTPYGFILIEIFNVSKLKAIADIANIYEGP